jgi:PPOX class probable F420-dependent enzyme
MPTDPLAPLAGPSGAWAREHLEHDIVGWLTTQAPDGRLQSSIVTFLWLGDSVLFYSQPDTPKLRNLAHSDRVAFTLQSDPYGDHCLIVEGIAAVDPSIPPSDVLAAYRDKTREPLEHWGMDAARTAREFSVPIRVRPTRIRCW